jgi:glycerol uptake facilitator-like aquaporin
MITNNMFVPEMAPGTSLIAAMTIEALFVMVFCWICLTMLVGNRYKQTSLQGIIIGLTLTAIAFIGGLFNPAVAVGSLVCNLVKSGVMIDFATVMVYVVGPLIGGFVASYVYNCCNDTTSL